MTETTKKNLGGKPMGHRNLQPDEATLKVIKGLGQIQATTRECAAVLGVSEPTYLRFKKENPIVADMMAQGVGEGRASLRRRQFKAAEEGNATMMVWLGKQYLEQKDRQEIDQKTEHTGAKGGPILTQSVDTLTDDELERIARGSGTSPADEKAGKNKPDSLLTRH